MSGELAGRNALVLGVERPAGRRAAVALAEAGADVAVVTLSPGTQAEFAANSAANEFWALGRRGLALTSDGREPALQQAIAAATTELGPVGILVWHAPHSIPRIAGLRSDPVVIVLVAGDHALEGNRALLDWTKDLSDGGLRANAVIVSAALAEALGPAPALARLAGTMTLAAAVAWLASDASAALEGAAVVAEG